MPDDMIPDDKGKPDAERKPDRRAARRKSRSMPAANTTTPSASAPFDFATVRDALQKAAAVRAERANHALRRSQQAKRSDAQRALLQETGPPSRKLKRRRRQARAKSEGRSPTSSARLIKRLIYLRMSGRSPPPGVDVDLMLAAPEPVTPQEHRVWRRQRICELLSLPPICPVRRCRRTGECCAHDAVCLKRHRGMASERLASLLGWADRAAGSSDDVLSLWGGEQTGKR